MDKYKRIFTYGGKRVHAVNPESQETMCKLTILYGDKDTDKPVTCKRCLKQLDKEEKHA